MTRFALSLLSLERGNYLPVPKAKDRLAAIVAEVREAKPDLLVCALEFLGSQNDVTALAERLTRFPHRTTVVVDAVSQHPKSKGGAKTGKSRHWLPVMVIEPHQPPRELARQLIAEASEKRTETWAALVQQLGIRDLRVKRRRVSCLCCGEINFLTQPRTGEEPFFHGGFPAVADHFAAAGIILNPTHDLMVGRRHVIEAKRRFLSRRIGGRSRCYVGVSNWDGTRYGQGRNVPTLHTVYVNGRPQRLDRAAFDRYGRSMACSRITLSL